MLTIKSQSFRYSLFIVLIVFGSFAAYALSRIAASTFSHQSHTIKTVIELGPYAINCHYLSGEGPGRIRSISVGDLIASQKVRWAEPTKGLSPQLADINIGNPYFTAKDRSLAISAQPDLSLQDHQITQLPGQRLYWCTGAKLELVDEHGRVLPSAEFLCHSLIRFNSAQHSRWFPQSAEFPFSCDILFNFTQGITSLIFPEGFGIPLNNNEQLQFEYKSLNRTSNQPRCIACRWTLYFIPDQGLTQPITALNIIHRGMAVLVGDNTSPNRTLPTGCGRGGSCSVMHQGVGTVPPNDVLHRVLKARFQINEEGKETTQHWVVPPGLHTYMEMYPKLPIGAQGAIRAAGVHVHPFCKEVSMIEQMGNKPYKVLFTMHCQTSNKHGLKLEHVDYLCWPKPGPGIVLNRNASYGWKAIYDNTSKVNQDAMVATTIYCTDNEFKKPSWAN